MSRYVILRQYHTDLSIISSVREVLRQSHLWMEGDGAIEEWVALPNGTIGGENFDRVAAFLTKSLEDNRNVTALVDEVDPLRLDPLMPYGWNTLIGMLILGFPEVRWHFLVLTDRPSFRNDNQQEQTRVNLANWERFHELHGIGAIVTKRGTPLFDGYGLRQHVLSCVAINESRQRGKSAESGHIAASVPHREKVATVLDEEQGYSWLEACSAYRHGFRAHAIGSWEEAVRLLGSNGLLKPIASSKGESATDSCHHLLSIEDWFLNFPDQGVRTMSDLTHRQAALPGLGLQTPPIRRFLTVGHERQKRRALARQEYLGRLRLQEGLDTGRRLSKARQIAYKPASGLYSLWRELGLDRAFSNEAQPKQYRGLAPGYHWPPIRPKRQLSCNEEDKEEGHSSPGRLLQIAEHLIQRATIVIECCDTVSEAIRGAVLATQALELLGCKTPTLSVQALALKHEFEVIAECKFVGVEYHLFMSERLADIQKNLKSISFWLHASRQDDFELNAEAMIITRLISKLGECGEFEESEECQKRLRYLHRRIQFYHIRRQRRIWLLLLVPVNWYVEFVLRSLSHYAVVIVACLVALSFAFGLINDTPLTGSIHAVIAFTVGELPDLGGGSQKDFNASTPKNAGAVLIMYSALAFGVLNFGLLVSHLYRCMVRK